MEASTIGTSNSLTDEDLARIALNKQRALEKRQRQLQEKQIETDGHNSAEAPENTLPQDLPFEPATITSSFLSISKQNIDPIFCSYDGCANQLSDNDMYLYEQIGERSCGACKASNPYDFELISQGNLLSEFLLPADTIKLMKSVLKHNPKNSMWKPMKLYLRKHGREKALARFGSAEALEAEKLRRTATKFDRQLEEASQIFNNNITADSTGGFSFANIDKLSSVVPPKKKSRKQTGSKAFEGLANELLSMNPHAAAAGSSARTHTL